MFRQIGKLFLVKPDKLTNEEIDFYKDLSFSNFIFFKEHFIKDFREYFFLLKEKLKNLKILAVDKEGGRVCRIEGNFESPLEIREKAKEKGIEVVKAWAKRIALSLKDKGLTVNLAPVVDRGDASAPNFLKTRTFGKDPQEIIKLAQIFIEVHKKEGLKTTLKHFPGLWGVEIDPHKSLPFKEKVLEEDILPFKKLSSKVDFLMTTHLLVYSLDRQKPVTFSEKAISFLREETDFKGALLTDDLAMGALKDWEIAERIVFSLVAGHNLLTFCEPWEKVALTLWDLKKELEKSSILKEKILSSLTILERY